MHKPYTHTFAPTYAYTYIAYTIAFTNTYAQTQHIHIVKPMNLLYHVHIHIR